MANGRENPKTRQRRAIQATEKTRDQAGTMRATPLLGTLNDQEQQKTGRIPSARRKNAEKPSAVRKTAKAEPARTSAEKGTGRNARNTAQKGKSAGSRADEIARRVLMRKSGQTAGTDEGKPAAAKKPARRAPAPKAAGSVRRKETGARRNADAQRQAPAERRQENQVILPSAQTRRRITPPLSQEKGKPVISQILTLVGKKPATLRSRAGEHAPRGTLRVIPLGGMCEIGKNMTAYEYGNDIIIVDCGQVFPDETMPGIDTVIPDFTYVLQNRDRVRGIFITHGHEDHIGGLPFLMQELNAPLYAGCMTVELLKYKLDDRTPGLAKRCQMTVVPDGGVIQAGCFSVEFIHVNHSIADAFMFAIRTPIGMVMHSGDFKIDYTPVDGEIMDLQRIAQLGRQGVLLFLCESTNIEVPGFTKSERHVGETLAQMFEGAEGRIFVATFSSNTSRLQQIFTAAERHGRKVALVGRSMLNVFNAANNLGYIRMKKDTLIDISEADNYPPEEVVIISTGSQGEPMSALTRIAFSSHKQVELRPGDTVILSSTPIPGNEKPIYKVINELYRRGCRVYYSALADVHVSGHASREELKLVHELIRPRYFIPAHGETRMLYQHAEMAHGLGTPYENIFILANGDIFEIGKDGAKVTGFTNGDAVLIDGSVAGEADNAVLQERRMLGDDGVLSAALAVRSDGELSAAPAVCAMGFLYEREHEKIEGAARQFLAEAADRAAKNGGIKKAVESGQMASQLRSFLYSRTKRRPVAMISLIELP